MLDVRTGNRVRWVGGDGGYWLDQGIYTVTIGEDGRFYASSIRSGNVDVHNGFSENNWELVDHPTETPPERFLIFNIRNNRFVGGLNTGDAMSLENARAYARALKQRNPDRQLHLIPLRSVEEVTLDDL